MTIDIEKLSWEKMQGLLPVIIQEYKTGKVLMLGYMNKHALVETLKSQEVIFFSRSQNKLWKKGETSKHTLTWLEITEDCDGDALLITAIPKGPTCHAGTVSCFKQLTHSDWFLLHELEGIISQRKQAQIDQLSYTRQLFSQGIERIAQKLGEEAVETVIAGIKQDQQELRNEAADLIFHLLVLLHSNNVSFQQVVHTLMERRSSTN